MYKYAFFSCFHHLKNEIILYAVFWEIYNTSKEIFFFRMEGKHARM